MSEAERLLELALSNGALRYGDFTLSSGQKTTYYFDGRLLTLHPEGAHLVGQVVLDIMESAGIDCVGGPTMSAVPMVTAVALASHARGSPVSAFVVRQEVKGHGTERLVEGHLMEGRKIAIVDDVCTTGASLFHAIQAVEQANSQVAKVIVIVDRRQGGSDELKRQGYDFTCLMEATPEGRVEVVPVFASRRQ